VEKLDEYFSEFAFIRYRVKVEVLYFIALCEMPLPQLRSFPAEDLLRLQAIFSDFSIEDALRVKEIEKVTNHDVKAVEYFLKEKFDTSGLTAYREFLHFGLTSQDINNTAYPLSIRDALEQVYYPALEQLVGKLKELAAEWKDIPMLARTHGQPASPTKLGKEMLVFVERLETERDLLKVLPLYAKFGGATGNFNAHRVAFPDIGWAEFADLFVQDKLGLRRSHYTTQIAHYDDHGAVFDSMKRINTILLDLDRDLWSYISMSYFSQKIIKDEVGSSTMPHKVNPIDFENSEGNLGIANAAFEHLTRKLPLSRLQRDLTDSTVTRFTGVPFAHTLIAIQSTLKGLDKLVLNPRAIHDDLENNWEVVAEAIQTILRREGRPHPYETLKELTRNSQHINRESIHNFILGLDVSDEIKAELMQITPQNYTGIF
jgi:adenylosuccinate lyase